MKALSEAKGHQFYRDHLPIVGEDVEVCHVIFSQSCLLVYIDYPWIL